MSVFALALTCMQHMQHNAAHTAHMSLPQRGLTPKSPKADPRYWPTLKESDGKWFSITCVPFMPQTAGLKPPFSCQQIRLTESQKRCEKNSWDNMIK
jgi:hypothetical protein